MQAAFFCHNSLDQRIDEQICDRPSPAAKRTGSSFSPLATSDLHSLLQGLRNHSYIDVFARMSQTKFVQNGDVGITQTLSN